MADIPDAPVADGRTRSVGRSTVHHAHPRPVGAGTRSMSGDGSEGESSDNRVPPEVVPPVGGLRELPPGPATAGPDEHPSTGQPHPHLEPLSQPDRAGPPPALGDRDPGTGRGPGTLRRRPPGPGGRGHRPARARAGHSRCHSQRSVPGRRPEAGPAHRVRVHGGRGSTRRISRRAPGAGVPFGHRPQIVGPSRLVGYFAAAVAGSWVGICWTAGSG